MPEGYLDYLTWQSRRVLLLPDAGNALRFSRMLMLQGECLPEAFTACEPMAAYQTDAQGNPRAMGFQEGRGLWRDSHCLLLASEQSRPPHTVAFQADCKARGLVSEKESFLLAAMGLCSDRAKISFWRHETLPLPLAYLGNADLVSYLREAIAAAEQGADALGQAVMALAERTLEVPGGKQADRDEVRRFSNSVSAPTRYWARLEQPFRRFMLELPGDWAGRETLLAGWIETVRRTARGVLDQIVGAMDRSPRTLRAVYCNLGRRRQWGAVPTLNYHLSRSQPAPGEVNKENRHERAD